MVLIRRRQWLAFPHDPLPGKHAHQASTAGTGASFGTRARRLGPIRRTDGIAQTWLRWIAKPSIPKSLSSPGFDAIATTTGRCCQMRDRHDTASPSPTGIELAPAFPARANQFLWNKVEDSGRQNRKSRQRRASHLLLPYRAHDGPPQAGARDITRTAICRRRGTWMNDHCRLASAVSRIAAPWSDDADLGGFRQPDTARPGDSVLVLYGRA